MKFEQNNARIPAQAQPAPGNKSGRIHLFPVATRIMAVGFLFLGYRQTDQLAELIGTQAWLMDAGILAFHTLFCVSSFTLPGISRGATLSCLCCAAACLLVLGGAA